MYRIFPDKMPPHLQPAPGINRYMQPVAMVPKNLSTNTKPNQTKIHAEEKTRQKTRRKQIGKYRGRKKTSGAEPGRTSYEGVTGGGRSAFNLGGARPGGLAVRARHTVGYSGAIPGGLEIQGSGKGSLA